MQIIEVVYSPLCEATGAMIGKLRQWLEGTDVQIRLFSFDHCPQRLKSKFKKGENCLPDRSALLTFFIVKTGLILFRCIVTEYMKV